MSFIGKLHEISLYGLISALISLFGGKADISSLYSAAFNVSDFKTFFFAYLFWASVAFLPIAFIGSIATKYSDHGEGLTFQSDNILVIIFAHIAEELLGIIATPFWFLRDLFTHNLDGGWKIFDYVTYAIEIVFIVIGFLIIW